MVFKTISSICIKNVEYHAEFSHRSPEIQAWKSMEFKNGECVGSRECRGVFCCTLKHCKGFEVECEPSYVAFDVSSLGPFTQTSLSKRSS